MCTEWHYARTLNEIFKRKIYRHHINIFHYMFVLIIRITCTHSPVWATNSHSVMHYIEFNRVPYEYEFWITRLTDILRTLENQPWLWFIKKKIPFSFDHRRFWLFYKKKKKKHVLHWWQQNGVNLTHHSLHELAGGEKARAAWSSSYRHHYSTLQSSRRRKSPPLTLLVRVH